jgi:hypothetical protein
MPRRIPGDGFNFDYCPLQVLGTVRTPSTGSLFSLSLWYRGWSAPGSRHQGSQIR